MAVRISQVCIQLNLCEKDCLGSIVVRLAVVGSYVPNGTLWHLQLVCPVFIGFTFDYPSIIGPSIYVGSIECSIAVTSNRAFDEIIFDNFAKRQGQAGYVCRQVDSFDLWLKVASLSKIIGKKSANLIFTAGEYGYGKIAIGVGFHFLPELI